LEERGVLNLTRSVKEWIKYCKRVANEHGFKIVWERKEAPLNPMEKLMLVVSECGEAMEAYRAQNKPNNGVNKIHCDNWRECFEEEVADIFVRLYHMCGDLGIDLEEILEKKMRYNKKRPFRHGKLI